MKAQILIVSITIAFFSCKEVGYSKASCDQAFFHDDNKQNDTNKIIMENRAAFDTTANMLRGIIIDSSSNKPIVGARVYMWNDSKHFSDSTDVNGVFQFFKDNFSGIWQMNIFDPAHQCLIIRNINIGGMLTLKIKLHN